VVVNDIHSQLNATRVRRVVKPESLDGLSSALRDARAQRLPVSVAGGRHAMGGQQFAEGSVLVDMNGMGRVLSFDPDAGVVEAEAGIQWPELIDWLLREQAGRERVWGIRQKQTGADRLSLGGSLAANVHGRGLRMRPIVGDVESITLVDAGGKPRTCSRSENPELFRLAIGGYGLFGIISTVKLRLAPRSPVERVVEVIDVDALPSGIERRMAEGFTFGDFQYATDPAGEEFLRRGVYSCYRPTSKPAPPPGRQKHLLEADWRELLYLAHADRKKAFEFYSRYYLGTSGQVYWSDTHQLANYIDNYHVEIDRRLRARVPGTEMITEIYVPRDALVPFMDDVRRDFRANKVDLIYGTIRLIEKDDETFLAWARERFACVIFNLHVPHSVEGKHRSADHFRRLIDHGTRYGGSYYLTYHRWARRAQVERCYPQFAEFLRLKRKHDPEERFQSEWYRHYRGMFADRLA
jgi:FAD/FMN-containing dehydrogenase